MELAVLNTKGTETGRKVSLNGNVFSVEPNDHAIWLDVKQYLANKRQGTHKTKDKSEASGSTKKLHRQKGTGGSRKGSIKSGTFVGGARIHGPRPRDYSFKLNKKLKEVARKSALTYKAKNNNIMVLEEFSLATPKTREYLSILENLKLNNSKTLMVVADYNTNLYLSSRNLPKARVMKASDLNTYEIMNAKNIILLENSVKAIEETLNK